MNYPTRVHTVMAFAIIAFCSSPATAAELPSPCRQVTGIVAQIDCLQDQQDLLTRVLQIEQTRTQIESLRMEQQAFSAPPIPEEVIVAASDDESHIVAEQIAWFDQQLEIYAVIGSGEQMTAYARLDGREYRLREGDSVRLARVIEVHPRGVELEVFGHELQVGLAGRIPPATVAEVESTHAE